MSNEAYGEYRKLQMKDGGQYQDFIVDLCWQTIGLVIAQYTSKLYQQTVGESRTGAEIKFDKRFDGASGLPPTNNLWIEVGEKAQPRPGAYAPSGIMRGDNSWLYIIGDYNTVFIFSKKMLLALHASGRYPIIPNGTKTSMGFRLPVTHAHKYASSVLKPQMAEKVLKRVGDLAAIGRDFYQQAMADPKQPPLFPTLFPVNGDLDA